MPTGTVLKPLHSKGYGFITADDGGPDVFLHVSQLAAGEESDLVPGCRVSYRLRNGRRGPEGTDIRVLSRADQDDGQQLAGGAESAPEYAEWQQAMEEVISRHVHACCIELAVMFGWK